LKLQSGSIFQKCWQALNGSIYWKLSARDSLADDWKNLSINWSGLMLDHSFSQLWQLWQLWQFCGWLKKIVNKLIWSDVGYLFSELWSDLPFFKMNLLSRQKRGKMVFSKRIWRQKDIDGLKYCRSLKMMKWDFKTRSFLVKVKSTFAEQH